MKKLSIKRGMTIPKGYTYAGAIILSVSGNGWCKGYYPSNVKDNNIEAASFKARAHWLVGVKTDYELVVDPS